MCTDGNDAHEIGEYGSLEGEQTVPRAEAKALLECLVSLVTKGQQGTTYTIYSDSKVTIARWHQMKYKAQHDETHVAKGVLEQSLQLI